MNTIIAAIFILVLFILSTAGREFERADDWETYFEREMEIQDSPIVKEYYAISEGFDIKLQRMVLDKADSTLSLIDSTTSFEEGMRILDSLWQVIQEWELIRYEGNCLMGIDYGDSIMVKKK